MHKKIEANWIDGSTPPTGHTLDSDGRAIMEPGQVSVFRAQIASMSADGDNTLTNGLVPLPPQPRDSAPVPLIVTTATSSSMAGSHFGRSGSRQHRHSDQSSIASVTVNGRSYSGRVFDSNGNPIN